jgi:uncharacterized protein YbjT (DUF2867 family)
MIVVTGATGNVGGEIVRALAGAGHQVRALVRPGKEPALPAGVEAAAGDLNQPATLGPALAGARGLFLLPGYENMADTLALARAAGVERVVLLSGSSVVGGEMSNAVSRYMMLSERAVRESDLAWTFLRPSAFMTNAYQWLPQLRAGDVVRAPFAGVRIASIDPADIAAVAAVALTSEDHAGQAYALSGPESLLPADRLRILGEVLGRDLRLEAEPDDEARARMLGEMPEQYVDAFFRFYVDGTLDESVVHPAVEQVTGRPPRTFREWAAAHADTFR